jgi:hypothetical protein
MELIGGLLLIALVLGSIWAASNSQKALDDPNNTERVHLEELPPLVQLGEEGPYGLVILRQSGNVHSEYRAPTAAAAVAQAMTTFRRAKIDAISITRNTADELHFSRLFYSHRGRAEGKKVGKVVIVRLD